MRWLPASASRSCSEPPVSSGRSASGVCSSIGPVSSPASICMIVTPVSARPPGSRAGSAPPRATAATATRGCSRSRGAGWRAPPAAGSARTPRRPARPAATRAAARGPLRSSASAVAATGRPARKRGFLHRACRELPAAALRPVRLRQHADDRMSGAHQRLERGHRELRRARECDAQSGDGGALSRRWRARAAGRLRATRFSLRSFSSFLRMRSRLRSER